MTQPNVAASGAAKDTVAHEWAITDVLDLVADVAGDREMLVTGTTRRTFSEVRDRTRAFGSFLRAHDLGLKTERWSLERWECGQSRVAILCSSCVEYIEAMIGSFRARAVPFNVNHHYRPSEIEGLLSQMGAAAVVYHRRFGRLIAGDPNSAQRLLIDIDDGSGEESIRGSVPFEQAVLTNVSSLPAPAPDDVYLICTGGTTGHPKGVMWRQADAYISTLGGVEGTSSDSIGRAAMQPPAPVFAVPPLMHSAGQRSVFSATLRGSTAVIYDDRLGFDACAILETAEREQVGSLTMIGDAYARRLVDEMRRRRYDLSNLRRIGTGGAMTSAALKVELLELLPAVTISDSYSSSETGAMATQAMSRESGPTAFSLSSLGVVISEDRSRLLRPDETEIGWTGRRGRIPLGYLHEPDKTAETFPVIDGERLAVPGDRARYRADGTIELLGRDSMVINSGGEKIFAEEVEEALRRHPEVLDALAVGRPSAQFGTEVVAIVQLRPGTTVSPREIRDFVASLIARFKAPRAVLICEAVPRLATGKGDYGRAKALAAQAVSATDN